MSDNDPKIPKSDGGKRPHATLDLKATEIKASPTATAGGGASNQKEPGKAPGPAPASTYSVADKVAAAAGPASTQKKETPRGASAPPSPLPQARQGRSFGYFAAGLAGGALALAAYEFALPYAGLGNSAASLTDADRELASRIDALEQSIKGASTAEIERKISELQSTTEIIPEILSAQGRLAADTKAALAAAESDTGQTEQLTRLGALEDKFKALADAGANDPNAGRLEQLAALTGKVSDLETSLATQLTELRKSVAADVDGRILAATEASESARSGAQRIDRDVASVKGEAIRIEERLVAMKADVDRAAAALKLTQEDAAAVKSELGALKSTAATAADFAAALAPVQDRIASLDATAQAIKAGEAKRQDDARRVALSLELQSLKRALDGGRPYASELQSVNRFANSNLDLSALEKFKSSGVPPASDLAKDFRSVVYDVIDAEALPEGGGVVDKLIAGARSVVKVRKANHTPDDTSTEAIVGRIERALREARLSDALLESDSLPPKAKAVAEPFLDQLRARLAVERAVASLDAQLKSSLGAPQAPAEPQ